VIQRDLHQEHFGTAYVTAHRAYSLTGQPASMNVHYPHGRSVMSSLVQLPLPLGRSIQAQMIESAQTTEVKGD
jgi:hypothetical protein